MGEAQTRGKGTTTGTLGALTLMLAAAAASAGCDSRLEPGEEGCEFDREIDLMPA